MSRLKHRVVIKIRQPDGRNETVLRGGEIKLREKLLNWLFGEQKKILVISPGDTVYNVEIHEKDIAKMVDDYLDEVADEQSDVANQ